jgi:hypothetical protein
MFCKCENLYVKISAEYIRTSAASIRSVAANEENFGGIDFSCLVKMKIGGFDTACISLMKHFAPQKIGAFSELLYVASKLTVLSASRRCV